MTESTQADDVADDVVKLTPEQRAQADLLAARHHLSAVVNELGRALDLLPIIRPGDTARRGTAMARSFLRVAQRKAEGALRYTNQALAQNAAAING